MRSATTWIALGIMSALLVGGLVRGEEPSDGDAAKARKAQLKAAARELNAGIRSRDGEAAAKAAGRLAKLGGKPAMKLILGKVAAIPEDEHQLYWALVRGAASFADPPALSELGAHIKKGSGSEVARDLVYALARNRSPNVVHALGDVLLEGPDDIRLLAVSTVGTIRSPEAVDTLIRLLQVEEESEPESPTQLMFLAASSLTQITHQEFGPASVNWDGWWKKNREKPLPRGQYSASLEDGDAVETTGTAVDFAKLDPARRDEMFGLEKAPPRKIVVLSAEYSKPREKDYNNDHMERVLDRMGIPHTVVRREDFLDYNLSETGVILVNCARFHPECICPDCKPGEKSENRLFKCTGCNKHIEFKAELSVAAIKKIQRFVQRGGYLFCEDWTVKEVVERAFPKYVVAGKKLTKSEADVVPARGRGTHSYLKGIFVRELEEDVGEEPLLFDDDFVFDDDEDDKASDEANDEEESDSRTIVAKLPDLEGEDLDSGPVEIEQQWAIDDESYSFKIVGGRKVLPLLASGDVYKESDGNGAVAVAFRPGKLATSVPPGRSGPRGRTPGVVLVVLSHFGKQSTSENEHSIQNILVNFLIDAHRNQAGLSKTKR